MISEPICQYLFWHWKLFFDLSLDKVLLFRRGKTDLTGMNIIIAPLPKISKIIERFYQVSFSESTIIHYMAFTRLWMLWTKENEGLLWKPGLRKEVGLWATSVKNIIKRLFPMKLGLAKLVGHLTWLPGLYKDFMKSVLRAFSVLQPFTLLCVHLSRAKWKPSVQADMKY